MDISVHPMTTSPTAAWNEISKTQNVVEVTLKSPQSRVAFDHARIVCMSDTHSLTRFINFDIPDGDIFIHAGDFTKLGLLQEVEEFNNWMKTLPHRHKIVIAGNHEFCFDPTTANRNNLTDPDEATNAKNILTNCTYIEDELIEIWGLRIYGSPWQPEFGKWAFNIPRGLPLLEKWNKIPSDIDILVTHGPPIGHGDLAHFGGRAGCVELLTTIQQRVKPKYHVFGHIHEGYGVTSDGHTTYVNASTCDIKYKPKNPPIVFDVPLPPGFHKDE